MVREAGDSDSPVPPGCYAGSFDVEIVQKNISHQMFYPSATPNSSVSQSECNHVTKSFSSEGLDLFRVLSKAINKLLNA